MISHVLAILTSVIVASAGARPWNLNEYPHLGQISARNREANSVVDTGCGDHIGGADRLCDPDKLLSREEAEAVQSAAVDAQEKVLHDCGGQQQGYQLAVALAKQIQVGRDVAASTETMARGIHDKWGALWRRVTVTSLRSTKCAVVYFHSRLPSAFAPRPLCACRRW